MTLRGVLVAALLILVGCGSDPVVSAPAETTTTDVTTTTVDDAAVAACVEALNVANTNVKTLLNDSPNAIAEGSPAAMAVKLRADADATSEIVTNATNKCADGVPACDFEPWHQWMERNIEAVRVMASILVGSPDSTAADSGTKPSFGCSIIE